MFVLNILTKRRLTLAICTANGQTVANTRVMDVFVKGWFIGSYVFA